MNKRSDKAQLQLSFGMIFSIILIIVFLSFAIFGILKFLEFNGDLKRAKITNKLQEDIDNMWKSSKGSQKVSFFLPRNDEAICFEYQTEVSEDPNFYFMPEEIRTKNLEHINWGLTQGDLERKCFEPSNVTKKIELVLEKDYGEVEVTISLFVAPVIEPATE